MGGIDLTLKKATLFLLILTMAFFGFDIYLM
jgi:hypothetical protein